MRQKGVYCACLPPLPLQGDVQPSGKEEPEENFIDFVDRLREAVGKQVEDLKTQKELLRALAKENANMECKRVFKALPPDPKPTIEQMVEACVEVRPEQPDPPSQRPPLKGPQKRTIGAATTTDTNKDARKCFNCRSPHHFAKNCPKPRKTHHPSKLPTGLGMTSRPCLQQHQQGNGQLSADQHCAMTAN